METKADRKICLFCETWASGGIESFVHSLLTHADLSGLQIDLVAARLERSVFTGALEALGVRFVQLSGRPRALGENRRLFRRLLERERYDVVHLHVFQAVSLVYAKLARQAGVPVRMVHSHNTALRKSLTRPVKLAFHHMARARYAREATLRLACSAQAANFLFGPGTDYAFVPNGVDVERFRFDIQARALVRRELGVGDETLVVGNVGRLCYQKNQRFLLDVFAALHRRRPDSRLLLVGQGEELGALQIRAKELGIGASVIFYGATSHVERLLWAMDAFALPSRFEGLSVAAVEAQAAGLPVLYTESLAPETAVTGRARAVRLDVDIWTEELLSLADRPGLDAERAHAADAVRAAGFDMSDVAERVRSLYVRSWNDGTR